MTPPELLLTRLDALATGCIKTEKAINSQGLNARLHQRAAPELLRRLSEQRKKIATQRSRIEKNHFSAVSWSVLKGYGEESSTLFGECLAFLQAARARGHDVEADLCEMADALLDEIAASAEITWNRFTVVSTEEFFRDFAQIIRLRFPFSGIWDLPVSIHEFGHFVAGRLNVARPDGSRKLAFQVYKEGFKTQYKALGAEWMFYLEEYFADVFATFALGPAYACTCLLLRFDPLLAYSEKDKRHPSYAKRADAILETLRLMSQEKDAEGLKIAEGLKAAADDLAHLWSQTLISAGQSAPSPIEPFMASLTAALYGALKDGVPRALFNRWEIAKRHSPWVEKGVLPHTVQTANLKISDLLNSAWLCRMTPGANFHALSDNVIQLSRLRIG